MTAKPLTLTPSLIELVHTLLTPLTHSVLKSMSIQCASMPPLRGLLSGKYLIQCCCLQLMLTQS